MIYNFPLVIYFIHRNVYVSMLPPQLSHPLLPTLFLQVCSLCETCESCSAMSNSLRPHGLYSPWNFPGQSGLENGVGSHSLLQGIFPSQGSHSGFPHCRLILYQLSYQRSLCLVYVCNSIPALQIKTSVRYHLTLVRMASIKISANHKCCRGCGEKRVILHCYWECKLR